jgi:hypothetical protein
MALIDTLVSWVNTPPAQIAAGALIAGFVWKSFERVQSVLSEDANLRIAVWLLDWKPAHRIERWPAILSMALDGLFGNSLISGKSFARSAAWTAVILVFVSPLTTHFLYGGSHEGLAIPKFLAIQIAANLVPDYASLAASRAAFRMMTRRPTASVSAMSIALLVAAGAAATVLSTNISFGLSYVLDVEEPVALSGPLDHEAWRRLATNRIAPYAGSTLGSLVAAFAAIAWAVLYWASVAGVRLAKGSQTALNWFNRQFDIEKKPLQAIGVLAGAIAAAIFWAMCLILHLLA